MAKSGDLSSSLLDVDDSLPLSEREGRERSTSIRSSFVFLIVGAIGGAAWTESGLGVFDECKVVIAFIALTRSLTMSSLSASLGFTATALVEALVCELRIFVTICDADELSGTCVSFADFRLSRGDVVGGSVSSRGDGTSYESMVDDRLLTYGGVFALDVRLSVSKTVGGGAGVEVADESFGTCVSFVDFTLSRGDVVRGSVSSRGDGTSYESMVDDRLPLFGGVFALDVRLFVSKTVGGANSCGT